MIKVVGLTSRQNFVWTSMTEIIPELESSWKELAKSNSSIDYLQFNVDETSIKEIATSLLQADYIYLSCFNATIGKTARIIRETLAPDIPFIIQLHGLATVGCWPLFVWGPGDGLRSNDIFVGTCEGDQRCLREVFKEPNYFQVHFPCQPKVQRTKEQSGRDLTYIGRISEQKNIHQVFWAISLLKQRGLYLPLRIFGKEDNLGSPNMGIPSGKYKDFLVSTAKRLGIESLVEFEGFVSREQLHEYQANIPHIFVSASLHSDENFGMAARQSLIYGANAILSDWGGHREHKKELPEKVELVHVYRSSMGPVLFADELANAIEKVWRQGEGESSISREQIESWGREALQKKWKELLQKKSQSVPLEAQGAASEFVDNWKKYQNKSQVFANYSDPLAHTFFRCYGMQDGPRRSDKGCDLSAIAPWVQLSDENFWHCGDPRWGDTLNLRTQTQLFEHAQALTVPN